MTSHPIVFVDSDVVISSLISSKGAAFLLLNQSQNKPFISNFSHHELKRVPKRLNLKEKPLGKLIKERLKIVKINQNQIEKSAKFVSDRGDAHIIAGARAARARFIITYNRRHYRAEKIKRELDIIVYTPAQLLQYHRSLT